MTQLYPHTTAAGTRHAKASAAKRLRSNALVGSDEQSSGGFAVQLGIGSLVRSWRNSAP
jgi:hypothetical protein